MDAFINLRLPASLRDALVARALELDRSAAWVVREALQAYLDPPRKAGPAQVPQKPSEGGSVPESPVERVARVRAPAIDSPRTLPRRPGQVSPIVKGKP